jgi:hypothetical protein
VCVELCREWTALIAVSCCVVICLQFLPAVTGSLPGRIKPLKSVIVTVVIGQRPSTHGLVYSLVRCIDLDIVMVGFVIGREIK